MDFQDNENNIQELLSIFQAESEEIFERIFENLLSLENEPANRETSAALYRDLHSIKGALRMVGFNNLQTVIHKIEDIFDKVNSSDIILDKEKINIITKSAELVLNYLQESVENQREIIGEQFNATVSALEYLCDVELELPDLIQQNTDNTILAINEVNNPELIELQAHQEEINFIFNKSFEIIDSIVPEEESQDIIILKEELAKIYEIIENTGLFEVKTSLQNVLTKLDFVMNATNTFTISEILELRNELSSAAAKFNTCCIDDESSGNSGMLHRRGGEQAAGNRDPVPGSVCGRRRGAAAQR